MKVGAILGMMQNSIQYMQKTCFRCKIFLFSYKLTKSKGAQLKLKLKLLSEMQNNYN